MKVSSSELVWSGLQKALLRALEAWRLAPRRTEQEYRDALFDRLRGVLPNEATVEKEYRHHGTTSDLYVRCKEGIPSSDTEVFFELKLNLKKKSQLDHLVGQIQGHDPENNKVFVVLFGESNPAHVGRLKRQYAEFLEAGLPWVEPQMVLVEIP